MKMNQQVLPEPLTKEREKELLERIKQGDLQAKNEMIERNLRLVCFLANKYKNNPVDLEDLCSIGNIGLIKAVDSFDPHKNVQFATYSSKCIENEILMYLRKNKKRNNDISIESSLSHDSEGNDLSIADTLTNVAEEVEQEVMKKTKIQLVKEIMYKLPDVERKIIQYRFGIDCMKKNQQDIAKSLDISQSYVSRIERKILVKMKREYERIVV